MFQVLEDTQVVAECTDLRHAAEVLLGQNMARAPRVVGAGETLIDVAWRFIRGDCDEPTGYEAHTSDARIALQCAQAMQRVRGVISCRAAARSSQLTGLTFQVSSSEGPVNVRLAWAAWPGFTLDIRTADDCAIVYSPWLDEALGGYGKARVTPTLDYFVAKAAEFGIELPTDKVELIHCRSLVDDRRR